mmetsp:Transcript_28580/g.57062  ORF Transcript_28580/g.57062 Transcript_28580/m.57062 type:complete len:121 (+) Transcript_28580:54-416(+)
MLLHPLTIFLRGAKVGQYYPNKITITRVLTTNSPLSTRSDGRDESTAVFKTITTSEADDTDDNVTLFHRRRYDSPTRRWGKGFTPFHALQWEADLGMVLLASICSEQPLIRDDATKINGG